MSDLAEFLLARIADDEAVAAAADGEDFFIDDGTRTLDLLSRFSPGRLLAECAAKRAIVERHAQCGTGSGYCDDGGHGWGDGDPLGCADLADLAAPYSGHPGFRSEWTV